MPNTLFFTKASYLDDTPATYPEGELSQILLLISCNIQTIYPNNLSLKHRSLELHGVDYLEFYWFIA